MGGIIVAISSVAGALGPMSLIGLALLGGGLLEIGLFLLALTKLDWSSIAQALGILKTYTDVIWSLILIMLAITGVSVVGGAASGELLVFAIGIAAIAAAMMLLAKAVYMLKQAEKGFDPWSSIDTSKVADSYDPGDASSAGYSTGENFAQGVQDGIDDHQADLYSSGERAGDAVVGGSSDSMEINSPSKVGYRIGNYFVEGIENALDDGVDPLAEKAEMLGETISETFEDNLDSITLDSGTANDIASNIADGLPDAIDNGAVADAWGDFAMDSFSDYFDDAPMDANISPIIESDKMEAEMSSDPLDGMQDTLSGLLANSDTNTESISSLFGEGGILTEIKDAISGLSGEDGKESLWDKATNALGLDKFKENQQMESIKSMIPSMTDISAGFSSAIGEIQLPSFDQTSLLLRLDGIFDKWFGLGGTAGQLNSIMTLIAGGKDTTFAKTISGELFTENVDETDGGNNLGLYSSSNGWAKKMQGPYGEWYIWEYEKDGQQHLHRIE